MTTLEETLFLHIRLAGLPTPLREFKALSGRKFKWDFAWINNSGDPCLLVEVQGGTFAKIRLGHSTGMGINRDNEKHNLAMLAGWKCLYVDTKQIHSGRALRWIQEALNKNFLE